MSHPLRARARHALRVGGWGLAAALAAFHAERLLDRLQQGELQGIAALRWVGAVAVLLALAALRRLGPIGGRRALALALAVLALHAPAAPGDAGAALDALAALPAVALPAVLLLVGSRLAAALVRAAHATGRLPAAGARPLRLAPARCALSPRPPPLRVRFR
ncbi:MAG: hypothetical protein AB7O37_05005 [Vicinamibacteria bacterium]